MSPDSASCSTRCGQRGVRRRLELAVSSTAASPRSAAVGARLGRARAELGVGRRRPCFLRRFAHLAVLEHRGVVGRVAHARGRWRRRARAPAGPDRLGGVSSLRRRRACRPSSRSRSSRSRAGHLVDRGGGDDQHPEDGEQHQQRHHDVRRAAAGRAAALETTKPIAPPACWSALGVAELRAAGVPLAMWTMPSTPKSSAAQPITWRPAGPLRSGSRRVRQATTQQQQRHEPAEQADRAGDDRADGVDDAAGELATRPRRRPRRRGRRAAARHRRDGARARAHRAVCPTRGRRRRWRGRPRARRRRSCRRAPEGARDRTRSGADCPRRRPLARWCASLLPSWRAFASPGCRTTGAARGRALSCATPAGKTYGSPWSRQYGKTSPVPCVTRRSVSARSRRRPRRWPQRRRSGGPT